jgi:hypothetical protein
MFAASRVSSAIDLPGQECAANCELLDGMFSCQLLVFCFLTFQNGQMICGFLMCFFMPLVGHKGILKEEG